ncbi:MAG: glucokinase [Pseudomonadota bacterium]
MASTIQRWLVADIGGTNSRVALWQQDGSDAGRLTDLHKLSNASFDTIDGMLKQYLSLLAADVTPGGALLAIAGPVTGDTLSLLNIQWTFNTHDLRATLGLDELLVINDFEALAYALPHLQSTDMISLGGGTKDPNATCALIGPGTGLGVAGLTIANGRAHAIAGEGGHVTLPATNAAEARLIDNVRERFGHCSAERILCGDGLELLHAALHTQTLDAEQISAAATAGDPAAIATFTQFFNFLATVAGDVALTLGARGGVYLGGGILPANRDVFMASRFRERFVDKGRYRDYLGNIPTYLITHDTPALAGLAGYLSARS